MAQAEEVVAAMSIAQAVHELERSDRDQAPRRRARALFKARQRALEQVMDDLEALALAGVPAADPNLRDRAYALLGSVHGSVPPWAQLIESPIELVNHLLVAEGLLRRDYYSDPAIDIDDD